MAGEKTSPDTPGKIAEALRRWWDWYQERSTLINGISTTSSLLLTILAFYAPTVLDALGQWFIHLATANATSTFLLLAVIGLNIMEIRSGNRGPARTDGGEKNSDATDPLLVLLIGLMSALVGSGFGDQWVVPGFVIGITIYLVFFSN